MQNPPAQQNQVNQSSNGSLVVEYFGDFVPRNELQNSVVQAYAIASEKTHLLSDDRPSSEDIWKFITGTYTAEQFLSSEPLKNHRIARTVRTLLAQKDVHSIPQLLNCERVVIKLAPVLYPGKKCELD